MICSQKKKLVLFRMSSFTVTFKGNSSDLKATFFPEIVLDEKYEYSCGLLDFSTYNSIPNVTEKNNLIHLVNKKKPIMDGVINSSYEQYQIPVGSYELIDLLVVIKSILARRNVSFDFTINKQTLKVTIECSEYLDFTKPNSFHTLLGFNKQIIEFDVPTTSENVVNITDVNTIRIECDAITGAYENGRLCHTLYQFPSNKVGIGEKIIEVPHNIIYLPLVSNRLSEIYLWIVDQDGNRINFRNESINCRIHIRREK